MKLSHYFNSLHQIKLSDEKKLALFHQIQASKTLDKNHSLTKRIFFQKKIRYSLMSLGLVFVFFGTYFWDSIETTNYRAFFAHRVPTLSATTADQIAKILEINGDYIIEKDGKQFFNSVLFDGDLITLKEDAKILFNVNKDAKIEIIGPAQFSINKKVQGGYLLKLIDGDFLSIESEKVADNITVETESFSFEAEKEKKINIKISKVKNNFQIKNQGSAVLVTKKIDNKETEVELHNAKMLTIQDNDISKIEDISSFKKIIAGENVTYTKTEKVETSSQTGKNSFENAFLALSGLTKNTEKEINPEIIEDLNYTSDNKKVPTEVQLSQITAALNSQFLISEMQTLYTALFLADGPMIQQSYYALSLKLSTIAQNFDIPIAKGTSNSEIIQSINTLISGLNEYHIPPRKITQLRKLKNRLNELKTTPSTDWDSFSKDLPLRLKFN